MSCFCPKASGPVDNVVWSTPKKMIGTAYLVGVTAIMFLGLAFFAKAISLMDYRQVSNVVQMVAGLSYLVLQIFVYCLAVMAGLMACGGLSMHLKQRISAS